jgi:DNA polymerase III subunit epsilon
MKVAARGLCDGFLAEAPWRELPIALLDLETTGRDAQTDRIVEVGIVIGQAGEVLRRHSWLVNPTIPIAEEARAVHGISNDDVKDAPEFAAIAAEVLAAMAGSIPAAYNAPFDRGFILAELTRAGVELEVHPVVRRGTDWLDPLIWARHLHSNERSRTLGDMSARLGIKLENAHRATDDAEAALRVLYALAEDARMPKSYGAFIEEQRRLSDAQAAARRMWQR